MLPVSQNENISWPSDSLPHGNQIQRPLEAFQVADLEENIHLSPYSVAALNNQLWASWKA